MHKTTEDTHAIQVSPRVLHHRLAVMAEGQTHFWHQPEH